MMENVTELEIRRMPDGGFLVGDARGYGESNFPRGPRFASTSIEEALKYIKSKLATPAAK